MSQGMSSLADVLGRLEALVVDDEAVAAQEREMAAAEREVARSQRLAALRREGIAVTGPVEEMLADGGEALRPTVALAAVRAWLSRYDVPPILALSGGIGCGKSVAQAYAIAHKREGLWRTAAQVTRIFAASFGEQYDDQDAIFGARMLVVDDVGAESSAPKMGSALLELLEQRKRSARAMRTILSTNLSRAEFGSRYPDPRLHSRMHQNAGVVAWVDCPGADLRRAGARP